MNGYSIDYRGRVAPGIGDLKFSYISSMPKPQDSTERLLSKITDSRVYDLLHGHGIAARRRIRIDYTADIQSIYMAYMDIQSIHVYGIGCVAVIRARGCKAVIVTLFKTRFLAILVNSN